MNFLGQTMDFDGIPDPGVLPNARRTGVAPPNGPRCSPAPGGPSRAPLRALHGYGFPGQLVAALALAVSCGAFSAACDGRLNDSGKRPVGGTPQPVPVSFERGDREVRVLLGGRAFTTLHFGDAWDKPFLYPLRTASGLTVSRGYPIEPREGEERDHDWHRGIWYGHGKINGHDFWRELGRDTTGMIVPLADPVLEPGPARGVVEMRFGLRPADEDPIGSLVQRYAISKQEDAIRVDADLTFVADRGQDLQFGDTEDGGFAMRLADGFRQDRGAVLLNSNGLRDTEHIWGQPARWVDYSGTVEGEWAGVAILDHPSNIRHPSRWHARGYSLNSANPFGTRDFTGEEDRDGSYVVPQGETLTLRYRVVIHDGKGHPETIERWFEEYASGPAR